MAGTLARRIALGCGLASSLLFGFMIWMIRYEGYSLMSQVPSELTAVGASTQGLWARLAITYTVLELVFGLGLLRLAGQHQAVRSAGALILAHVSLAFVWPFAPMHPREVLAAGGATAGDTLHQILGAVTVFLMFLIIAAGSTAFGRGFRIYSIASIVVLLVFGTLTFAEAPRLQAGLPTPRIGLWERLSISAFLQWAGAFALLLWPARASAPRESSLASPA